MSLNLSMRVVAAATVGLCICALVANRTFRTAEAQIAPSAVANTFAVTKTADTNDGVCDADCSLREAIGAANANPGADIITLPAGTYLLTRTNAGGTNEDNNATGDLDINGPLTINGAGAGSTVIEAGTNTSNGIDKVIAVNPLCTTPMNVTIDGVTISFGRNTQPFNAPDFSFTGGGIDLCANGSGSVFTLSNSVVSSNTNVNGYGGGLNVDSSSATSFTVNLTNDTFQSNQTLSSVNESNGGAINLFGSGFTVNVTNSTFTGNHTTNPTSGGGAIHFRPTTASSLNISGSTFTSNTAPGVGGAIDTNTFGAGTTIAIQNSTFTGNTATNSFGGALYFGSTNLNTTPFSLTHLTITGNTAGLEGGGVYVGSSNVALSKSLIVGNSAPTGSGLRKSVDAATANVTNDWWGCSTGPGAGPCNTVSTAGGTVTFNPWYRNQLAAGASPLVTNQATTLTASFLTNSAGTSVPVADLAEIIGRPVTWAATNGDLSGTQATVQSAGTATGNFRANAVGTAVISAKVDNDNTAPSSSNVLSVTVGKANTSSLLGNDTPDPSVTGQPVTVTYSVTGMFGNIPTAPTGNVTVSDGTDSCTGTVAAGQCNVTFRTAGAKTLTATYAGDANFNASPASSSISHTVNKADTTTTITSDTPDPSVTGQLVAFNVSVAANSPGAAIAPTTITGSVTVSDGGTDSCIATLAAGIGSCSIAFPTPGSFSMTGTYGGNSNFNASPASAIAGHTVNKGDVTLTVSSNRNPSITGQSVTFSATIAAASPAIGTPTGTIQFVDGATNIGAPQTISAGSASVSTSSLTAGTHTITAQYIGDTDFNSGSNTLAGGQVVNATAQWTGSADGVWTNAANWSTGLVPAATNSVSIPATGVINNPVIGGAADVEITDLTLGSGRTLTISNGRTLTVDGLLTMNGNNIDATNGLLVVSATGTAMRTAGAVIGTLNKLFAGPGSFTYPVGTLGAYSPVDVTVTSGAGNLSVKANIGTAPATPPLDSAKMLQRYFTLNGTGITSDVTFHYLDADIPGTSTESQYDIFRIVSGSSVFRFHPNGTNVILDAAGNTFTVKSLTSYSDWTAGNPLAPTAANVRVGGRVFDAEGNAISRARVAVIDQNGRPISILTNVFGYYSIDGLGAGGTYLLTVTHRQYRFTPRVISVPDNITDLDIYAEP